MKKTFADYCREQMYDVPDKTRERIVARICFNVLERLYEERGKTREEERERCVAILEAKKWIWQKTQHEDVKICYNLVNATLDEAIRLINSEE